ncbi:MAG TPA: hypothetical protein VGK23_12015 [Methanomassiliicoccales archaeon]
MLETHRNPYNFPHDMELYYGGAGIFHDIATMRKVSRVCRDFDLVHVHGGLNRKRFDVLAMRFVHRKPIVVHYHGSETRMGYGMAYRSIARAKIVSRPDLLRWHADASFIPNPIEMVPECLFDTGTIPKVVHVSNNPLLKGTEIIKEAMDELIMEGLNFKFELVENQPHEEVLKRIASAQILIDQVLPTSEDLPSIIGMVSLEAMVRGRAVVSTFDREFRSYYPECPVRAIEYGKASLKEEVSRLVSDMNLTMKLGALGRKYVADHHSPKVICDKVQSVYDKVLD